MTKKALLKMVESGSITSLKDNMQLNKAMCRLMMTPRLGGLSAADMFYGRKAQCVNSARHLYVFQFSEFDFWNSFIVFLWSYM